jgi:protein ImuB
MARLNALMGEGRCGAPATVDSWRPGAFAMAAFNPKDVHSSYDTPRHRGTEASISPVVSLRRFRLPIPARVHLESGKPSRVTTDRRGLSGGRVEQCAGPWRTSGAWWEESSTAMWDHDEWDVTLNDGATYRVFHERDSGHWLLEGIVD